MGHQLRNVRPTGGFASGEGHHGHSCGPQAIDGLLPLLRGQFTGLPKLLAGGVAEDTFLITLPFAMLIRHGTDHQIHSMRCRHFIPVGADGQLPDLGIRITSPSHSEQHTKQFFHILLDILFGDAGIDLTNTADRSLHDRVLIRLRDRPAIESVHFLHELRKDQRPRMAQRQKIVAVQDHDICAGTGPAESRRDQMDPHHPGPLRIEGAMADPSPIGPIPGDHVM